MPNVKQVWQDKTQLTKDLGLYYYVHQDFSKQGDISSAFDCVISARVPALQIGYVEVDPLQDTNPLTLKLLGGTAGAIQGRIDNFAGYLPDGTQGQWTHGGLASVRFLLTLNIDVTIPIIGKVTVDAGHKQCTVPLHWDAVTNQYVYVPQ